MVILLPYLECNYLNNGSVITLSPLLLSCSVTAHHNTRQCLEEDQGVTCEVNPHLGWEVQSDAPGTTYNGNSTDKIRCRHEVLHWQTKTSKCVIG